MPTPREPRRVRLSIEHLEDRAIPSASLVEWSSPFSPDRVLITMNVPESRESWFVEAFERSSLSRQVTKLGFGVYSVELSSGTSLTSAIGRFSRIPGVAAVQPDYQLPTAAIPNDPLFSRQWNLQNSGQTAGRSDADLDAPEGWQIARGTGQTIVAVIDSGIDSTHPDLAANLWRNPREIPGNGVDDDGNGFVDDIVGANFVNNTGDPLDRLGHGTHVAGIIGAVGNNGVGISGVAWNTRIMALKFIDDNGIGYTSNAIRAIDYAIQNGARIINASWGGGAANAALEAALARARTAGVIVVMSAGNGAANTDTTPFYPAGYIRQFDNIVTVAATNAFDALTTFSNYGSATVTLAAPGERILSTEPGGRYAERSGTSMAVPHVVGSLAVLWDANPSWSYQQVIARLKATVDPLDTLRGKTQTGGRLNLANLLGVPPPVVSPPPSSGMPAAGPRIIAAKYDGPSGTVFDRVRITFSEPIDSASFTRDDILSSIGPGGAVRISSILPVAGSNSTQFQLMFSTRQSAEGSYQLVLSSEIRNPAGQWLDQNQNGIGGEVADRFVVTGVLGAATSPPPTAAPPGASPPTSPPLPSPPAEERITFSAGGAAIADRATTRIRIPVAGTFRIADLDVHIDLQHGRTSDLSIRLIAPTGEMITLFNRRSGADLRGTIFDDQAMTSLRDAAAPFTGRFRPEQALSQLEGKSAAGIWLLDIFDVATGVTGQVNGVTLSFRAQNGQTPANILEPLSKHELEAAPDSLRDAMTCGRSDQIIHSTG